MAGATTAARSWWRPSPGHIAAYPVSMEGGFSRGPATTLVRDVGGVAAYSAATPDHSRILIRVSPDAAKDKGEIRLLLRYLRRFEIFETGGVDLATAAARNYRQLRARGKTVRKTSDCLIATFCLEHAHALLHCDRDFDAFEEFLGLEVVHPGVGAGPATR